MLAEAAAAAIFAVALLQLRLAEAAVVTVFAPAKKIYIKKHVPQARFFMKQNALQARPIKQNAPQARIFGEVLMGTVSYLCSM